MTNYKVLTTLIILVGLGLVFGACRGADAPPQLPVPNEPTLVYIYTDG